MSDEPKKYFNCRDSKKQLKNLYVCINKECFFYKECEFHWWFIFFGFIVPHFLGILGNIDKPVIKKSPTKKIRRKP